MVFRVLIFNSWPLNSKESWSNMFCVDHVNSRIQAALLPLLLNTLTCKLAFKRALGRKLQHVLQTPEKRKSKPADTAEVSTQTFLFPLLIQAKCFYKIFK